MASFPHTLSKGPSEQQGATHLSAKLSPKQTSQGQMGLFHFLCSLEVLATVLETQLQASWSGAVALHRPQGRQETRPPWASREPPGSGASRQQASVGAAGYMGVGEQAVGRIEQPRCSPCDRARPRHSTPWEPV